jgi:hypothetical protein
VTAHEMPITIMMSVAAHTLSTKLGDAHQPPSRAENPRYAQRRFHAEREQAVAERP